MPSTRARMLPLALALVAVTAAAACGHKSAPTSEPPEHAASPAVPADPAPADPAEDPESAPATEQDTAIQTGEKTASKDQQVTFDDDADPEPTTQIQGAPKRPPMPRFKLFGTREGDGPN